MTLALVPPEKVGGVFVDIIMEEAPVRKFAQLIKLMDNMTMNSVDDDTKFPIKYWNHCIDF